MMAGENITVGFANPFTSFFEECKSLTAVQITKLILKF